MSLALSEMQQLMHELGPAMPEVEAVVQHEAGSWDIWFEGDVCMGLDWQPIEPRLRLSMALGDLPEAGDSVVCQALLKANLVWSSQDAVRAAMCDAGQLMLLAEHVLSACDLPQLQQQLRRFVLQASQFAAVLRAEVADMDLPAPLSGLSAGLPEALHPSLRA